jgi:DEAD/DEAH box helicase domain-containing protein
MNPVLLGRQVEASLKDLLRATLNTTSPAFEGTVERFLSEPANYIKGPWISVAMPFRQAVKTDGTFEQPFTRVPLRFAPYHHQMTAFGRLSGANPRSTLVATGTGSGKTESYLWPILEHCRISNGKPGIKAILIYPMNALATDQARRIARAIAEIPALNGVRAGIYADAEPNYPTDAMTADDVITRRAAMRANAPDILLTNYKMLDYLLLRASDQPLWARNTPETLRYLVVDELHTFDGAQGADLALLIRRLKHRLGTPGEHLICVGSSATLGSGEEAAAELRTYAGTIFGESFDETSVIREIRQTPAEVLRDPEYTDWPEASAVEKAIEQATRMPQAAAAQHLARCLFPLAADPDLVMLHEGDPSAVAWRLLLGRLLLEHLAAQRLLRVVSEHSSPASLATIAASLGAVKALTSWNLEDRSRLAELIVSLIAWARAGSEQSPQPLFGIRIQFWVREMSRMVANVPRSSGEGRPLDIELLHAHDLDRHELRRVLPIVNCNRCGTAAHLGRLSPRATGLWASLPELYEEFFDGGSSRLRLIYYEHISRTAGTSGRGAVIAGFINAESLEFTPGDQRDQASSPTECPAWLYDPTDAQGEFDRTCPACGHAHGLLLFGLRAARLTAALTNTVYVSEQNEEDPKAKPRLLMFSDSVQDAAQRAAVAEIRNSAAVMRKSVFQAVTASPTRGLALQEVIAELPERLRTDLGSEAFVGTFIARDQTWREPYQELLATNRLPRDERFLDHVKLRLGWEYFSDLTYRSHTSQTLEAVGLAVAEVSPDRIQTVATKLPRRLANALSGGFDMDEIAAGRFLHGLLQQMRRRGAVGHPYVTEGMSAAPTKRGGPNYFAASRTLGLGRTQALPIPNHRTGAAPRPATLLTGVQGYESLLLDHSTNWYRDWADKFFGQISLALIPKYDVIFDTVFSLLEAEGIVRRIERPDASRGYGFVIEPASVIVSADVSSLRCDRCRRLEITLAGHLYAEGAPCTRIGCHGVLRERSPARSELSASLLASNRNHRIVGREHTGILEADDRRALETGFIRDETPWAPNLISATPTLEMGIDIGDLSTLLLCSVPPEEANYVQRIGRTGRRDGNSLNLTMVAARPHDLQFWAEPDSMLAGQVRPPGVHVGAVSVLLRQVAAFTLDCLVANGGMSADYGKVRDVLRRLAESPIDKFPFDWFHFLEHEGADLAKRFLGLLPPENAGRPDIVERLTVCLTARDHRSLIWHIRSVFDDAARERDELIALRQELDAEARRIRRREAEMTPQKLEERLNEIKRDKGEINHAIRQEIDDVPVLRFLTDKGVLPNYAFPEQGIKLKSILARQPETGRREENGDNLITHEYVRPASSALTEFAPGQTFYANGREVVIDRLGVTSQDFSTWRFCQTCSHVEFEATAQESSSCPRCGDDMWNDTGSSHEAVELKTVVAVTKEQEAAIRDADDRRQRHYDRTMVPFYGPAKIETSWYAEGGNSTTPFGFEFVAPVEFRDFNFGTRATGPVGPRIAGQQRSSRPFRICRHCGIVQLPTQNDDDAGRHQPRCKVLRRDGEIPRDSWEAQVFLVRRFETETIRMVVPVAGEASDDDIKSFVAAINLGMRKHFAGKVDHIRSTVVEAQLDGLATVRSLFLYDAVPGGSGYLRQIAEHPDSMRGVIEKGAEALRTCPCNESDKNGCFRCVKSYRALFGPGEPDRDIALQMMEDILSKWGNLTRTGASIDSRIRDFLVESRLEARFLETLEVRFGAGCIKPQVLEGGRKGFLLTIGEGGRGHFWTIETQVQIDRRYRDVPMKRVDFLISPVGAARAKPIVVEMDGLETHAETVADDLATRLLLIRSGHVRVWTLGWHDLGAGQEDQIPNPIAEARLGASFPGLLARVLSSTNRLDLTGAIDLLQRARSLEGLLYYLEHPHKDLAPAASVLCRTIIGQGRPLAELPGIASVTEDGRLYLQEGEMFGHVGDRTLDFYLAVGKRSPREWADEHGDCRVLLRGRLPEATESPGSAPGYSEAWRGLWRIVNLMQDVRGFHVEFDGLDTLASPDLRTADVSNVEGQWLEALSLVDDPFRPLVEALHAARAPAPNLIGADLTHEGEVVGMVEFGWSELRLAVCEAKFEVAGWDLVPFDPTDKSPLIPFIAGLVSKLEERAA